MSNYFLQLGSNNFSPLLSREGLGSLNWCSYSTVDDELRKNTNSTGNTEKNSVVVGLSQAIVLEKDTRVLLHVSL
jgi:hypothetical protein